VNLPWSQDTVENYMNAAQLAKDSERVRNLQVPLRIIYDALFCIPLASLELHHWIKIVE